MSLIEGARRRPILVIGIALIAGSVLLFSLLSIFEEGKYIALRPVDGSEVQGLEQEIHVDIRFELTHTIISSGSQQPSISLTGINTTYQWDTTPSIETRDYDQKIFYHAEHMFPGFGFYRLSVRVYYLHQGNVSDVRVYTQSSTFEVVETPEAPVIQEETDVTTAPEEPTEEPTESPLVGIITKGLGIIVLIAGVVAIYYFYIRKRYKII